MPLFLLSHHVPYACARSGACCTSGWDIPVDASREHGLDLATARGTLRVPGAQAGAAPWRRVDGLRPPDVGVLARTSAGACVFFDAGPRACAIHAQCGEQAMPVSCRQFPRVAMVDDRGVHVTLSHYCPTAAGLLIGDGPVHLVTNPPGWTAERLEPGLDARGEWPPLLRPGVLLSLGAWTQWERFALGVWWRSASVGEGLARLQEAADRLARWTGAEGPLDEFVAMVLEDRPRQPAPTPQDLTTDALARWTAAWTAVPPLRARRPGAPSPSALARAAGALARMTPWASRYLASRCVASWAAYQADGVQAFGASLRTAAAVLLVEIAREPAGSGTDREVFVNAVRRADLLLVHLCEGDALAECWNTASRVRVCTPRRFRES